MHFPGISVHLIFTSEKFESSQLGKENKSEQILLGWWREVLVEGARGEYFLSYFRPVQLLDSCTSDRIAN